MQEEIKKQLDSRFEVNSTIQGNTVKATVPTLNGEAILGLAAIYGKPGVLDVKLKRSGTSITILVEV